MLHLEPPVLRHIQNYISLVLDNINGGAVKIDTTPQDFYIYFDEFNYQSPTCKLREETEEDIKLVDKLTINYNRSRQAAITKELIEIISGAESL